MGNGMKFAGVLGVAAVLCGGAVSAYAFSDTVKNQVKLTLNDPQEYFEWVCEKNTADAADLSSLSYQKYLDQAKDGSAMEYSAELALSEEFRSSLIESAEDSKAQSVPGVYDSNKILKNIADHVQRVSVHGTTGSQDAGTFAGLTVAVNDADVCSLETVMQNSDSTVLMRIPELTQKWLAFDIGTILDGESVNFRELAGNPEKLITPAELSELITGFSNTLTEGMTCTAAERSAPLTLAGTEVKYTALSVSLTAEQLRTLSSRLLDFYEKDALTRSICIDRLKAVTAEQYAEEINQAREKLEQQTFKPVTLKLYTDFSGTIRGFSANAEGGDSALIGVGMQGAAVVAEYAVSAKGNKITETLNAHRTAEGWNGTLTAEGTIDSPQQNRQLIVDFRDIRIVDAAKGLVSGVLTADIGSDSKTVITLETDGSRETIRMPIADQKPLGDLTLSYSFRKPDALPDTADRFVIDKDQKDPPDFKEYVSKDELNSFTKNTLTALGVPEEDAKKTADTLTALLYWEETAKSGLGTLAEIGDISF